MSIPAAATVTLPITGMSCAACSSHIEQTLTALPGVQSATVSLLANQATVTSTLPPEALIAAIQDAGYDAAYNATIPGLETATFSGEDRTLPLRTILALLIAAITMTLGMALMHSLLARYAELLLTLITILFLSPETYRRALAAARHRTTNMSTLVALGTLAALAWSLTATLAPALFLAHHLLPDVYFEAIDFILAFLLLGAWLDSRAKRSTQSALTAFNALTPSTARTLRPGPDGRLMEVELPIAALHPGDHILLRPGNRIPVDALILSGISSVDESLLTGESRPILKRPGDAVIGGAINLDGPLTLAATTLGEASTLAQLRRLLAHAQSSRAPMQRLADRASAIFVPIVLALAALTFAAWAAFAHDLPRAFAAAIAVLVIACPCAMGLAVPAALTVGIGRAAQLGILVKDGEALERLALARILALDKTGTLTEGRPTIVAATFSPNIPQHDHAHYLHLAAALESHSEHPLARAVQAYAASFPPSNTPILLTDILTLPGTGITATYEGQPLTISNTRISFAEANEDLSSPSHDRMPHSSQPLRDPGSLPSVLRSAGCDEWDQATTSFQSGSHPATPISPLDPSPLTLDPPPTTKLHLTLNRRHILTLEATDTLRLTAAPALIQLRTLQITPHILTGDNPATASHIATLLNIPPSQVHAQLLPAGKLALIQAFQQQAPTAMAGDGLNDAAALAAAGTGIAISGSNIGTDLTREAAALVLLRPDLTLIPQAIRLARHTTRAMRQNLAWAVAYNALGLPIAAGALYPHFHLLLSPILASAAMALSSLSVLANSLRLRRFQ